MNSGRTGQIGLGILLIVLGLSSLGNGGAWGLMMAMFGLILLSRGFDGVFLPRQDDTYERPVDVDDDDTFLRTFGRSTTRERPYVSRTPPGTVQPQFGAGSGVRGDYPHALSAARAVGLDPDDALVAPTDVGLLVTREGVAPMVYRTAGVPTDLETAQPFVELRLDEAASGLVRFELYDDDDELRFVREEQVNLRAGRNLVVPSARLRFEEPPQAFESWRLRVYADGVPVAEHNIALADTTDIGYALEDDGEVGAALRAEIEANTAGPLSLDELLGDDDNTQARRAGR